MQWRQRHLSGRSSQRIAETEPASPFVDEVRFSEAESTEEELSWGDALSDEDEVMDIDEAFPEAAEEQVMFDASREPAGYDEASGFWDVEAAEPEDFEDAAPEWFSRPDEVFGEAVAPLGPIDDEVDDEEDEEDDDPEGETALESLVSSGGQCRKFPRRFRSRPWSRRVGPAGRRALDRLRRKGLITAALVRGTVRLPVEQVRWLFEATQNSSSVEPYHWVKNLEVPFEDLASEYPRVNVVVQLFEQLAPGLRAALERNFERFAYLQAPHACRFTLAHFGAAKDGRAQLEPSYGIDLNRFFRQARLQMSDLGPQHLLVTYVMFPSSIEKFVKYTPTLTDNSPSRFSEIPAELEATRLGRLRSVLPVENTRWMIDNQRRRAVPSFLRRMIADFSELRRRLPWVSMTVELFRFDGSVVDLSRVEEPTAYMLDYVRAHGRFSADDRHFVSVVLPISRRAALEDELGMDLTPLEGLVQSSRRKDHYLLIYMWFPDLGDLVVDDDYVVVRAFVFGKSHLTRPHKRLLKVLAGHVVDTWLVTNWRLFRPVRELVITGHTDTVGTEGDNEQLGLARAEAVEKFLNQEIDRLWARSDRGRGTKALSQRICFTVDSKGETLATPDVEKRGRGSPLNRLVEVGLKYAKASEERLSNVLAASERAFADTAAVRAAFSSDDDARRARCMLKTLQVPGVNDLYVIGGNVHRFESYSEIGPFMYRNLRTTLMEAFTFRHCTDEEPSHAEVLQRWKNVYEAAIHSKLELSGLRARGKAQTGILLALLEDIIARMADDKSIYCCLRSSPCR